MQPHTQFNREALRHPDSQKWSKYGPDVLPFWIADMDFPVSPAILEALRRRLERSVGYAPAEAPRLKALLAAKLGRDGLTGLSDENVSFLPGVVPGLYAAVLALTQPGDEVLTFTPIYPPFLGAASYGGRIPREVPLRRTEAGWQLDMQALEEAVTSRSKLLMLCHPRNPTGRVWTSEELTQIADFALRHDLYVVSDELHADLRYGDAPPYLPFAAVSQPLSSHVLMLTGPCKAYNTAGLGIGAMVCPDPALLTRLQSALAGLTVNPPALSLTMWEAALTEGGAWLEQTLAYLRENRDMLSAFLSRELPELRFSPPQATYLAWLDLRAFAEAPQIQQYLLDTAKIALNDGPSFGAGYQGFVRLNFATDRNLLMEGLQRLKNALDLA